MRLATVADLRSTWLRWKRPRSRSVVCWAVDWCFVIIPILTRLIGEEDEHFPSLTVEETLRQVL